MSERRFSWSVLLVGAVLAGSACQTSKSANPLSPSVAGPIPGVEISAPKPLEPGQGWEIATNDQPLRLLLENSATTGERPLTYRFEVASDPSFVNMVYSRGSVPPGQAGRTAAIIGDTLPADRVFYWRAKADDGANASDYSPTVSFTIVTPVSIETATLLTPIGNVTIESQSPTFRMRNPATTATTGGLVYTLYVATSPAFTALRAGYEIPAQPTETEYASPDLLDYDTTYYWKVRVHDTGTGVVGPWSITESFRTPAAPAPPPPPPPTPGPGPTPPPSSGFCSDSRSPAEVQAIVLSATPLPIPGNPEPFRDKVLELVNDPNWGYHKRPNGKISADVVAWNAPGGNPHHIWDIVAGSKGSNPEPSWTNMTSTIEPGSVFIPFCP